MLLRINPSSNNNQNVQTYETLGDYLQFLKAYIYYKVKLL
ncbi:hypothetical protein EDC17_10726 [Sphingobacterium alimentarium]|uniref:Uncharacterized protein n=1 Tax=Sphingobacterium alimentarium TaxID=797292 RepID=A0A4V6P2X6_9SPHI|nr:hypothetical protein EDC17_10726 [Sphingobacterium alimentarium]